MKNDFNKATKTDMPLDEVNTTRSSSTPKKTTTTTKPKITKIGGDTKSSTKKSSSGTIKTTTTKTTTKTTITKTVTKSPPKTVVKSPAKSKLKDNSISNKDLEKMNEEKVQSHSFRGTRNRVIIIALSVLLIISILAIVLYSLTLESDANCFLYLNKSSDIKATYIINNEEMTEFRTPSNFRGGTIFQVDIDLKISSSGRYKISYYFECYVAGNLMKNVLVYQPNYDLFYPDTSTNSYYTLNPVNGNQTISLSDGVVIDSAYANMVDPYNFTLKLYTKIEKI
ncbi:MAG: hypothetical protein ACLRFL_01710 [Clostridia bacterium]